MSKRFASCPFGWTTALLAAFGLTGAVAACTVTPSRTPGEPHPISAWHLSWSDEFDGPGINRTLWSVENASTFGDGNSELACLMDRPQNVQVSGGWLTLRAQRERPPLVCGDRDERFPTGRDFSSAMLSTRGKSSWRYGRFEIRARLPTVPGASKGLWPAFWLRPVDGGGGEIDILEALGTGLDPTEIARVHQTIWHDDSDTYPHQSSSWKMAEDPSAAFHVYAVEWESGILTWFVDGQQVYQRTEVTTPWLAEVFSRPFFIRLNLAVGGSWPGPPSPATVMPAAFEVDWVRVYQR